MRTTYLTVRELKERLSNYHDDLCISVVDRNWLNESGISIFDKNELDDSLDFIECPFYSASQCANN